MSGNDSRRGGRVAALVALVAAGGASWPGSAPASTTEQTVDERIRAVRERLGQLGARKETTSAEQVRSILRRFAQWSNWPNWYNGWGNWGNWRGK